MTAVLARLNAVMLTIWDVVTAPLRDVWYLWCVLWLDTAFPYVFAAFAGGLVVGAALMSAAA